MTLCTICGQPKPKIDAATCSQKCQKELHRLRTEEQRRRLRGKTCPTCSRYIPTNSTETGLVRRTRLLGGQREGNAGRFA
jgi:hypothetical protein